MSNQQDEELDHIEPDGKIGAIGCIVIAFIGLLYIAAIGTCIDTSDSNKNEPITTIKGVEE